MKFISDENNKPYPILKNYNSLIKRWLKKRPWVNVGRKTYLPLESKILRTPTDILSNTNINGLLTIKGSRYVKIGRYCDIAENLFIISSNHEVNKINIQSSLQSNFYDQIDVSKGPVYIGNNVWIGDNVTILSGVSIGDGAVIGAGSVVTKSIPPFAIAAGVPADIIRYRFPKKVRERLLLLGWWHWDKKTILNNKGLFISFINKYFLNSFNKKIKLSSEKEIIVINMRSNISTEYLLDGWGQREGNFRWMEKSSAGFILKIRKPKKYSYLEFICHSAFYKQKVKILINNKSYKSIIEPQFQKITIKIKTNVLKKGTNRFVIYSKKGVVPKLFNKKFSDTRKLYIKFKEIRLKRLN